MIHDPTVEVTCDGLHCSTSEYVPLHLSFGGIMHTEGSYAVDEPRIARYLTNQHDWVVQGDQYFCSVECAAPPAGGA